MPRRHGHKLPKGHLPTPAVTVSPSVTVSDTVHCCLVTMVPIVSRASANTLKWAISLLRSVLALFLLCADWQSNQPSKGGNHLTKEKPMKTKTQIKAGEAWDARNTPARRLY
jgi:hypothetical protein